MNILIEKARSGTDNLVFVIDNERHPVYSLYDPVRDGERFHRECFSRGSDFYIMIGIGLGYHIRPFLENTAVKKIVVLEPFEEICKKVTALKSIKEIAASNKVEFFCGKAAFQFIDHLTGRYDYLFYNRIQVLSYPPLKRLFGPKYKEMETAVKNGLDALVKDGMTIGKFARVWLRNFIVNLNNVKKIRLISSLYDSAKGAAVITGAGPSLDRTLPKIKDRRKSLFLIATDASVKPLIRNGIKPDLIVTMDPQAYVRCHFEGLDRSCFDEIPAVLSLLGFPAVVDIFRNKYFFFTKHPTTFLFNTVLLKHQNAIVNYQSVSSLAFKIAFEMGFREIYLSGFDFSYPGMRVYANRTFFYDFWITRWMRPSPVQTIESKMIMRGSKKIESPGTGPLYSNLNLLSYLRELENVIDETKNHEKMITRTWKTSGLPVRGAEYIEEPVFDSAPENSRAGDVLVDASFKLPVDGRSEIFQGDMTGKNIFEAVAVTLALRNRIYRGIAQTDEAYEISRRYISKKLIKVENSTAAGK